jgi:hypothetical protein
MSEYVRDTTDPEEPVAHGVDLVDDDTEPAVRILVRGDLPDTLEHDGRTWVATGETHDDEEHPIAVFRPQT